MLKYLHSFFRGLALLGALALAAATLVTVADVVLRKIGTGIIGAVDLVQLFVVAGAFLAMPYAFAERAHIAVDLILDILPPQLKRIFGVFTGFLVAAFCGALVWYTILSFVQVKQSSDISMNIGIPMWYYWLPFTIGLLSSLLALAVVGVENLTGRKPASEGFNEH